MSELQQPGGISMEQSTHSALHWLLFSHFHSLSSFFVVPDTGNAILLNVSLLLCRCCALDSDNMLNFRFEKHKKLLSNLKRWYAWGKVAWQNYTLGNHWVQQVYYRTIRTTEMLGLSGHDCQVVFNMGAGKNNFSSFKTSIFTLALIFTETVTAQIVQNGGFESGKWCHPSVLPIEWKTTMCL